MKSRILSLAAIAGMLVATGCSGGGSGTSPIVPKPAGPPTTGTTTTATVGRNAMSFSFLMPAKALLGTTSTGRHVDYISPGSSGIQVLFSGTAGGSVATFAIGTPTTPLGINPNGAQGVALNTGTFGFNATQNTPGQTFLGGFAQNANQFTDTVAVTNPATTLTVSTLPNSSSITPAIGQPFTVTSGAATANLTVVSFTGNATNGLTITARETNPASAGGGGLFPVGSSITYGTSTPAVVVAGSSYTYTVVPQTGSTAGFYLVTFTFNNLTASTGGNNTQIGVVLTDISNTQTNPPILSENQTAAAGVAIPAFGNVAVPLLTLNPVVAGVYMPATPILVTAGLVTAGQFETTVFETDARGFVIQNQTGVADGENQPTISITATGLTMATFNAAGVNYTSLGATSISNTAPPTGGTRSVATPITINFAGAITTSNYVNPFGTLYTNVQTPLTSQPYTATVLGAATNTAGGAGNPLNLACTVANPSAGLTVTLQSKLNPTVALTAPVFGYTYILGTNYPNTTVTTLSNAVSTSTTPTGRSSLFPQVGTNSGINCNPSITLPIN